jgi:hypothetical protein
MSAALMEWVCRGLREFAVGPLAGKLVPVVRLESSDEPVLEPDTPDFTDQASRPPSAVTPVAITTGRDTTRPSMRALREVVSMNRYGKTGWESERAPKAATSPSSSTQMRLT